MRIYNRKDFLALPPGTMYAKGEPWAFNCLSIKADNLGNDWVCLNIPWVDARSSEEAVERLEDMLHNGSSYPLDEDYGRDGTFDDREVFFVFELDDLVKLKGWIDNAIVTAALASQFAAQTLPIRASSAESLPD